MLVLEVHREAGSLVHLPVCTGRHIPGCTIPTMVPRRHITGCTIPTGVYREAYSRVYHGVYREAYSRVYHGCT